MGQAGRDGASEQSPGCVKQEPYGKLGEEQPGGRQHLSQDCQYQSSKQSTEVRLSMCGKKSLEAGGEWEVLWEAGEIGAQVI